MENLTFFWPWENILQLCDLVFRKLCKNSKISTGAGPDLPFTVTDSISVTHTSAFSIRAYERFPFKPKLRTLDQK
jgi:hypothetical protein